MYRQIIIPTEESYTLIVHIPMSITEHSVWIIQDPLFLYARDY